MFYLFATSRVDTMIEIDAGTDASPLNWGEWE